LILAEAGPADQQNLSFCPFTPVNKAIAFAPGAQWRKGESHKKIDNVRLDSSDVV
jgi:hypothetical protein